MKEKFNPYFDLYKGKSMNYSEADVTKSCIDLLLEAPPSDQNHIIGQLVLPQEGVPEGEMVIWMPKRVDERRARLQASHDRIPELPKSPPFK